MDQDAKKTALRMIPYGIYVLTADDGKGNVAAATVNWVTQTAFAPPFGGGWGEDRFRCLPDRQEYQDVCLEYAGQGPEGSRVHLLQADHPRGW